MLHSLLPKTLPMNLGPRITHLCFAKPEHLASKSNNKNKNHPGMLTKKAKIYVRQLMLSNCLV